MKYAGIINNDVVNGKGVCVSFWSQGCPHRCPGCHNPQTWDFDKGIEGNDKDVVDHIIKMIRKNDVQRNLSILGGEPLCNENLKFTHKLITCVKKKYPNISIFIWTGYTWEELIVDPERKEVLEYIDVLVDGKFIPELRSTKCLFRGSTNQRLIDVVKSLNSDEVILYSK